MNTIITTIYPKIDIHSHLLYGVDDGSKDLSQVKDALKVVKESGIESIVCTPHFMAFQNENYDKLVNNYKVLKKMFSKEGINIYLKFEFKLNYNTLNILKNSAFKQKYLLIEFSRNENMPIDNLISLLNEVMDEGYKIVLAHPEFYFHYHKLKYVKKFKECGCLIQIDATSVIKSEKRKIKRFARKLLKKNLVDIVASDYHDNKIRSYDAYMKGYYFVKKKYGFRVAQKLFCDNPKLIVDDIIN